MKKNTAKKRGWVPYVVAGLALSFVLSLLFPPDEEASEAPPAPITISANRLLTKSENGAFPG